MKFSDWLDEEILEDYLILNIPDDLWDRMVDYCDELEEAVVQDNQDRIKKELLLNFKNELQKYKIKCVKAEEGEQ